MPFGKSAEYRNVVDFLGNTNTTRKLLPTWIFDRDLGGTTLRNPRKIILKVSCKEK